MKPTPTTMTQTQTISKRQRAAAVKLWRLTAEQVEEIDAAVDSVCVNGHGKVVIIIEKGRARFISAASSVPLPQEN